MAILCFSYNLQIIIILIKHFLQKIDPAGNQTISAHPGIVTVYFIILL